MANALSALRPTLFSAARQVGAEPFGAVSAIDARFDDQGVAKGDTVTVPIAPTRPASDFMPSNITSTGGDSDAGDVEVEITKSRKVDWHLTGEQQRSLENATVDQDWVGQLIAQGMRTLRNEAEADCAAAIKVGASRAYGSAGTTPFAADLSALTGVRKILQDNGAPLADLQFVGDSSAGLNLRNLGIIQNADQAGTAEERRSGNLQRQFGFEIRESAGVALHTKGAGTGYQINNTEAVDQTTLSVDSGTVNTTGITAGDVITIAGDSNKYIVNTGLTSASGDIVIGDPGLRAEAANNAAITVGDTYTANVALERSAVVGIMRPPLMPANPTIQQMLISDEFGMTYLMLDIAQYGQRTWELHLAWGFKAVNPDFIAVVLG